MSPRKIKMDMSEMNDKEMNIATLFNKFIEHCKIMNYSKATINYYSNTIHNFGLFISLSENPTSILTISIIEDYTRYLQGKRTKEGLNLKGKTISTYLIGLRTILNWCYSEGYIPRVKVKIPKYDQPLKVTYTEQQLQVLIKKPDISTCKFTDIRDWALINYLLGTGQRLSTVINLRIGDIDFNENTVTLNKLKNRTRVILPLAGSVVKALKIYIKYRKGTAEDYLFCNTVGGQLSAKGAQDAVSFYNRSRGVPITSVHAFRHTFAKRSLLAGMDIVTLQQLMTHRDLNSTRVYLSMTTEDLRIGLDDFNPLSRLQTDSNKRGKIRIDRF